MLEDWVRSPERAVTFDENELISPELALVDPELAARARAALPARVSYLPTSRALRLVVTEPSPTPAPVERSRISRHPILFAATAFVLGCASSTAAWMVLSSRDEPSAAPSVLTTGARDARPPAARAADPATPSKPAPRPAPTVPVLPPVADPVASPQFTWAPVTGAQSYRLVLYRSGTRIYEAVTAKPRQTVPLRWTFRGKPYRLSKGTYRWVVIPRLGAPGALRDGDPVVNASYTI